MSPSSAPITNVTPVLVPASGVDCLRKCLRALRKHTKASHQLYIVDDCSPSVRLHRYLNRLESLNRAIVFRSEVRRGFAGIHNWAVEQIPPSDYICLLNPDAVVGEYWLLCLLREMDLDSKVGLVRSRSSGGEGGAVQRTKAESEEKASFTQTRAHRGIGAETGVYALIRRAIWEQLGGFDPVSSKGQLEDDDLYCRIREAGWRVTRNHYKLGGGERGPAKKKRSGLTRREKPRKKGKERFLPGLASIVVVNYNTRRVTADCLKSVLEKTVCDFELIAVDNGSKDDSVVWLKEVAKYPNITLVTNKRNQGWTIANNQGIRAAKGEYYLLLNSDTIIQTKGWLQNMIQLACSDDVGTVGAKLLYPDGRIQHIGGSIHETNPFHPYDGAPADIPASLEVREVPFVTGACLLIKKSTIERVGMLDEGYFLGYSDVEYGLRCIKKGLKNLYCPTAVLTHLWAYTQRKTQVWIAPKALTRFKRYWSEKLPGLAKKVDMDWDWPVCANWIRTSGPGSHIATIRDEEEEKALAWGGIH